MERHVNLGAQYLVRLRSGKCGDALGETHYTRMRRHILSQQLSASSLITRQVFHPVAKPIPAKSIVS